MDHSDSPGTDKDSTPTFRLVWATDIHLNFLKRPFAARVFGQCLREENQADAIVLSGDLSTAPLLEYHLTELEAGCQKPLYFVLGNHDYYSGSFAGGEKVASAHKGWLDDGCARQLTDMVALIGCEGWYDALFGNPYVPKFGMSDWREIQDIRNCTLGIPFYNPALKALDRKARTDVIEFCRARSKAFAEQAKDTLLAALKDYERIVFATHVPPFAEATWHEGAHSDSTWVPWFSSKQMGEMLIEVMGEHPKQKLLVLCGHTHSSGIYDPLPNVRILTGESRYGAPDAAGVLKIAGNIQVSMKLNHVWTELPPV